MDEHNRYLLDQIQESIDKLSDVEIQEAADQILKRRAAQRSNRWRLRMFDRIRTMHTRVESADGQIIICIGAIIGFTAGFIAGAFR